ncbi:MAG: hypothetical protein RLZZ230_113 [Candidatus Parcubacteria bacterium]|jgi:phage shock protein PspC (stress-responsive transcriptional regulator)
MKKKLERDEEKAVMGGVLAGLAKYFGKDPVLFRVLAITFLIMTGIFPGILIYIAAWLVMSRKGRHEQQVDYEVVE